MSLPNELLPVGLLGTGAVAAEGYAIERSVRFNSSDSAYLSRTPASAGNRKTWTWAGWVKRSALNSSQVIFSSGPFASPGDVVILQFSNSAGNAGDTLNLFAYPNSVTTTRVFRDTSAWYHIVWAFDTTQSTASNRSRLYVNGAQVTDLTGTYPTQNQDYGVNAVVVHAVGRYTYTSNRYFNGYLADIHFIDGQALDPTSFGEFDTNGIWQPKAYTGSYGTNGFHLDFSDNSTAAALGTDTSPNGNDWDVNNLFTRSVTTLPAVAFDGSGDYLQLAYNSDWDLSNSDFTIEAFINSTDTTTNYPSIIGRWQAAGQALWDFRPQSTDAGDNFFFIYNNGSSSVPINSGAFVCDGSWHHLAVTRSGTNLYMFVDGVLKTTHNIGTATISNNTNVPLYIGYDPYGASYYNGFTSNLRLIKGTALYTSNFTPPSAPLTAVTNTKLLCCQSSNSATAATVSPGTITANGDVSATTRSDSSPDEDSLVDVPTNGTETDTGVGGEVRGNYATLNFLTLSGFGSLKNGNLEQEGPDNSTDTIASSTIAVNTGKWYWEVTALNSSGTINVGTARGRCGIKPVSDAMSVSPGSSASSYSYLTSGQKINNSSLANYGTAINTNDVVGIALDLDAKTLTFYLNGVSQGVAYSSLPALEYAPSLAGAGNGVGASAMQWACNFGQRPFAYTAPSGFKALCTANLPAPVVTKPSEYMDIALYTGNGGTQTVSGLEFSPDLVWVKSRNNASWWHVLTDAVRGGGYYLHSNNTNAEGGGGTSLVTGFTSDGFTLNNSPNGTVNNSGDTYVAWTWDAGSSTVTNTNGSITSQVRANPSAGFSIFSWVGTGASGTIGHGLGVTPKLIIIKTRSATTNWVVFTTVVDGSPDYLYLNLTNAKGDFNSLSLTTSTFNPGGGSNSNPSGQNMIAYCFAPVDGYSSFGSYTGNGSADGPFVFTNHRPRWILLKRTDTTSNWTIIDTAREGYNVDNDPLYPNLSNAEGTTDLADILSNGFKLRSADASVNANAGTYIYASFAEQPFQYSRAR
jgi:hypothetical protein